jgi:Fe2+ transport system protein FeoA
MSSEIALQEYSHDMSNAPLPNPSSTPLDTVEVGQKAVVADLSHCPVELLKRLVCMGVVAGSEVTVTQRGFFGSPINIRLFGSVLSLRSAEAALVNVQPV